MFANFFPWFADCISVGKSRVFVLSNNVSLFTRTVSFEKIFANLRSQGFVSKHGSGSAVLAKGSSPLWRVVHRGRGAEAAVADHGVFCLVAVYAACAHVDGFGRHGGRGPGVLRTHRPLVLPPIEPRADCGPNFSIEKAIQHRHCQTLKVERQKHI